MQPLHLVCQKYVRKRKGAVKMCITCKNVTEMYVNCDSRNAHGFVYKVEIISLTFKWLIALRYVIKRTESLKMCLPGPKTHKKRKFTRLAHTHTTQLTKKLHQILSPR